jgi:2-dehydropantoate 2-reductase
VKIEEKSLAIERLFQEHGIEAEYTREAVTALWKKFILISGLAGMTALTRLTIGEILAVGESRALFLEALRETAAVARARGVDIPDDYPQHILSRFDAAESDTRSSLFYDLTHQKPMELEALSGTVIRLGESLGIATPIHRMIYAVLLPYHLRHSRRRTTERISTT